jgi:hypothetical protein
MQSPIRYHRPRPSDAALQRRIAHDTTDLSSAVRCADCGCVARASGVALQDRRAIKFRGEEAAHRHGVVQDKTASSSGAPRPPRAYFALRSLTALRHLSNVVHAAVVPVCAQASASHRLTLTLRRFTSHGRIETVVIADGLECELYATPSCRMSQSDPGLTAGDVSYLLRPRHLCDGDRPH